MTLATLKFGPWGGPYRHVLADGYRTTDAPPNPYRGGYGQRIPTRHMIFYAGHWHRVYVAQWSNAGTPWINVKGVPVVVDID